VDRAALDVALELGLPCCGWCPLGRRAEDGPLPARYPLRETPSPEYPQRTEWNIRDADATLVLHGGRLDRGTALTSRLAGRLGKPLLIVDLSRRPRAGNLRRWVEEQGVRALNVAGPRESRAPGIHARARAFLRQALAER
jgi:putative molybdenum carrier protein